MVPLSQTVLNHHCTVEILLQIGLHYVALSYPGTSKDPLPLIPE